MTLTRARSVVRSNREEIVRQLGLLAREAGTSVETVARALQAEIDAELGASATDDVEESEPREVLISVSAEISFEASSQEEVDAEVDRIIQLAEGEGFVNVEVTADDF